LLFPVYLLNFFRQREIVQEVSAMSVKKKAVKKKAGVRKTAKKPVQRAVSVRTPKKERAVVEPGPPSREVPPVEEPAKHEMAVGNVTHYYSHLGVATVQINASSLDSGDTIRIKGHSTDLTQTIDSMEYEHSHVDHAVPGQCVGLLVSGPVREHDIVYVVK
jgi:hypothetical protein